MKMLLVSLSFLFLSTANAELTKYEKVEKIFELTNVDQYLSTEGMLELVTPQIVNSMKQKNTPQKEINKAIENMKQIYNQIDYGNMKRDFADLYLGIFDEDELDEMIRFYTSDAGKKMLEKQPLLTQEVMAISMKYVQKAASKTQKK